MVIPIDPVSKPRMTRADRWKKRKCVLKYFKFKDDLEPYKKDIIRATEYGILAVIFTIPMPKSWSKKKRLEMNLEPHKQRPDIDNLAKSIMDAVFDEDSHIWEVRGKKIWGESGSIEIIDLPKLKLEY